MPFVSSIGIIGAGNAAKAHINAADNMGAVKISGLYSIGNLKDQRLKNVSVYSSVNELIDKSDAIIVATPNYTHADYVILALEKNKPVLCEKPMATNVLDAEQMAQKALSKKTCFYIGYNYRFLGITRAIKLLIDEDGFGEILSIEMELKRSSAVTRKNYTWRDGIENNESSGALGDLGSHLIDILYYLFQTEINLNACMVKTARYIPTREDRPVFVDDYAVIYGRLYNGIYFKLLSSKVASKEEAGFIIKIIGKKTELFYNSTMRDQYFIKTAIAWSSQKIPLVNVVEDPPTEIYGWSQSFVEQLKSWIDSVNYGKLTEIATFQDGLRGQKVLSYFLKRKTTNASYV